MHDASSTSTTPPDLEAIDQLLTAARDHAHALESSSPPGSERRTQAHTLLQQLERAGTTATWLMIAADQEARRRGSTRDPA